MDNKYKEINDEYNKPEQYNKNDVDINNISSILKYIIEHYEKFLLLFLVIVIIGLVDYISNINAIIYGATSNIQMLYNKQPSSPPIQSSPHLENKSHKIAKVKRKNKT